MNGFDFNSASPVSAGAAAAYNRNPIPEIPAGQFRAPGGLTFASANNRNIYKTPGHYFSPRFHPWQRDDSAEIARWEAQNQRYITNA